MLYLFSALALTALENVLTVQVAPNIVFEEDDLKVWIESANSPGYQVGLEGDEPKVEAVEVLQDGQEEGELVVSARNPFLI